MIFLHHSGRRGWCVGCQTRSIASSQSILYSRRITTNGGTLFDCYVLRNSNDGLRLIVCTAKTRSVLVNFFDSILNRRTAMIETGHRIMNHLDGCEWSYSFLHRRCCRRSKVKIFKSRLCSSHGHVSSVDSTNSPLTSHSGWS